MRPVKMKGRWSALRIFSFLIGAVFLAGCAGSAGKLIGEVTPRTNVSAFSTVDYESYEVRKIVVLPFKNDSNDEAAGFKVASYFYNQLSTHKEYEVSPPLKEEGERMRTEFMAPRLGELLGEPETQPESREEKEADEGSRLGPGGQFDAVVTGRILRYRDNEGTTLLTLKPASVAYEIYLISTKDGSILWQAEYEETQEPLNENLLLMDRYMKGGFRWWTSDQMTRLGMERVIDTFPGIKTQREVSSAEQ